MCGSLELYRQRTRRRSRGHWVRLPAGAREQEERKGEDCLWGEEKKTLRRAKGSEGDDGNFLWASDGDQQKPRPLSCGLEWARWARGGCQTANQRLACGTCSLARLSAAAKLRLDGSGLQSVHAAGLAMPWLPARNFSGESAIHQFTAAAQHSTAQHCTGLPPAVSEHPTLTKLMSCTFLHCPAQFQLIINHPLSRPSPATPDCQNNNHQHTTHDTRHTTHATRVHHCCIAASIAISARINRPVPPAGCALGCPPGCPASQKRSEGRRAGIPA